MTEINKFDKLNCKDISTKTRIVTISLIDGVAGLYDCKEICNYIKNKNWCWLKKGLFIF